MYRGKYHLGLQIDIVIKFPMYILGCFFQGLPYIFASFGNVDSSLLFELEIVFLILMTMTQLEYGKFNLMIYVVHDTLCYPK